MGVLCKCKRTRSVVKADGNPRRHLCIWKPPSHTIWNGVVYRGKIKHAVICRQFEAPCPPCRPPSDQLRPPCLP